jgi:hypothetical protein
MSLGKRLISGAAAGPGPSTTAWISSDMSGNLFYTQAANGQSGWTDTGISVGTGYINDAVYNGLAWVAATSAGLYSTSDTTATSGWSQIDASSNWSTVMWTGTGWIAGGDSEVKYTTNEYGATDWTNIGSVTSGDRFLGIANNGTYTFFGIRTSSSTDVTAYTQTNFFGNIVGRRGTPLGGFLRGAFYDNVNSRFVIIGGDPSIAYSTTVGGSFTEAGNAFPSNGIDEVDYNGSYYATSAANTVVYGNTDLYSTSWTTTDLSGFNIDRLTYPIWNGTAWMAGTRYTSGSVVMASRENSNPNGTWTSISAPTGFADNRSVGVFPSKRPYYNTLTNLGT